jgi:hypothetical protein
MIVDRAADCDLLYLSPFRQALHPTTLGTDGTHAVAVQSQLQRSEFQGSQVWFRWSRYDRAVNQGVAVDEKSLEV